MPILISFCNQTFAPSNSLLLVDESTRHAQWVEFPSCNESDSGCTGIETVNGRYYVLTQSLKPQLLVFDQYFQLYASTPLHKVRDAHSICHLEGFLYIVSTGNNSVYRLPLEIDGKPVGEETLYWRYPGIPNVEQDLVHLNSIAVAGSALLVTCFGKKVEPETWKTTTDGFCIDITDQGRVIAEGLRHPHTVKAIGDALFICASNARELLQFRKVKGTFTQATKTTFEGYTRGFAVHGSSYFIGQSENRKKSRSRGTDNIASGEVISSKIYCLNQDFLPVDEILISAYGAEVYDICYIESLPFGIMDTAKDKRIGSLEELLSQRTSPSSLEKDRLLVEKETQLASRTEWARALEQEATRKAERIVQLQQEVEERNLWALKLRDEVGERDRQIRELQRQLAERTAWAVQLSIDLEERHHRLATVQQEFNERSEWTLQMKNELEQRNVQMARSLEKLEVSGNWSLKDGSQLSEDRELLEKTAPNATSLPENLSSEIRQYGKYIDALLASVESLTGEISVLRETISNLTGQLAHERELYADEISHRDQRLAELHQSISWKITAPLRSIYSIFRTRR